MYRLILVFAGNTSLIVGFVMRWLIKVFSAIISGHENSLEELFHVYARVRNYGCEFL